MAKKIPELNTSSMADISFLLLTFFLLTSSIDTDSGLLRKLPPLPTKDQENIKVKERNVLPILINAYDKLMVKGKIMEVKDLRKTVKEFFLNPYNDPNLPEKTEVNLPYIGKFMKSKGIISLKNDRGTSYEMYIKVSNEITAAINELRDELSMKVFNKHFKDLVDEKQIKAISDAYPMAISEAEPEDVGGTKK